jgi:hypothetical protein
MRISICKYRILECVYNNGHKNYKVQINPLFGFPFLWFTASFCSLNPPHPDLAIPAFCEVNCIFGTLESAKKCLIGLSNKNSIKIICKKVIK